MTIKKHFVDYLGGSC